jgi:hypothetical protein
MPSNIFSYEFCVVNGEGVNPGRFELRLMHNAEIVEVVPFNGDVDAEVAIRRGKEWVAKMEKTVPPS